MVRSTFKSWMRAAGHARTAVAGAAALAVVLASAASLPAQAASHHAVPRVCGATATVHLHGKVFHVQMRGRFGIVPMRGHKIKSNQPVGRACRGARSNAPQVS